MNNAHTPTISESISVAESGLHSIENLTAEVKMVRAQNAELVKALREMVRLGEANGWHETPADHNRAKAMVAARAALAGVTP